jgi:hypothetical protein
MSKPFKLAHLSGIDQEAHIHRVSLYVKHLTSHGRCDAWYSRLPLQQFVRAGSDLATNAIASMDQEAPKLWRVIIKLLADQISSLSRSAGSAVSFSALLQLVKSNSSRQHTHFLPRATWGNLIKKVKVSQINPLCFGMAQRVIAAHCVLHVQLC